MSKKRNTWFAWGLFILCAVGAGFSVTLWGRQLAARPNPGDVFETWGWNFTIPLLFSGLGALIISRQSSNRVGWLMMIIALASVNPAPSLLRNIPVPPASPTPGLLLLIWLDNGGWVPVIFPILLIPLFFPTGSPPSIKWNWVAWLAIGMMLFFLVALPFNKDIGPISEAWRITNPIGFLSADFWNGPFMIFWGLGLATVALSSVVSLYVRYRQAQPTEREQIKWLLYAGALFASVYSLVDVFSLGTSSFSVFVDILFVISILGLPVAIAVAILRYRLYDIDVIIRRTLQYTLLTGSLALVYFGGVVLLQGVFERMTGKGDSALITVISTLGIVALFNPLRKRIQDFIDRRFYRQKYDADQALAQFAVTARDEMELEGLTRELVQVVQRTLKPESVSLWVAEQEGKTAANRPIFRAE